MFVRFNTSGAAFGSEYEDEVTNDIYARTEVVRILKKVTVQIENGEEYGPIMDINGNKIGEWSL